MDHRMAAFLQLLKETGVRAVEGWAIKWSDIDTERSTVTFVAEKHSYSRTLKITDRCLAMLNMMPKSDKFVLHHRRRQTGSILSLRETSVNRESDEFVSEVAQTIKEAQELPNKGSLPNRTIWAVKQGAVKA